MQACYLLNGGQMHIKKYKVNATHAPGIVVLRGSAAQSGLATSTTTSWADSVGLVLDQGLFQGETIPYSTVQGDPEAVYSILINSDLVIRILLVGSATNAILTDNPILTASTDGLTAVGTNSVTNLDGGTIWYTSGPNVGASRIIESVSSATATVLVPFAANVVGDIFLTHNARPGIGGQTLSTNLLNSLQNNTALTGTTATMVDHELNGNSNSYLHVMQQDHVFVIAT
jgi:hypothetical protein